MQPKISIIIPVYNAEKYITKCIESVTSQTYKNLEIIMINDGSIDKSRDLCEYYSKKDNRIIYITQHNKGISAVRNTGLDIATGEYIGFVDSDDWIESDMYELLYKNLCIYNTDISMCNSNYVDENENNVLDKYDNIFFERYNLHNNSVIILKEYKKIEYFVKSDNNYLWNKLYKKNLFNYIKFPEDKIYEDIFISSKIIDIADKIVISPEYKYNYLRHNNSITNQNFKFSQFNIIEAYIHRYNYLIPKYLKVEKSCRKYIFNSLLNCTYQAYKTNNLNIYRDDLQSIISEVKKFNIYNCGLDKNQENLLIWLFNDIEKYIVGMKVYNNEYIKS